MLTINNSRIGNFRGPKDAIELWAGNGIIALAGNDTDRARCLNGVGFGKFDGDFGHSLAGNLRNYGRLSDKQWAAALRLARKYRRQLPAEPSLLLEPVAC